MSFIESGVKDTEKVKRNIRDAVSRVTDLPDEVTEAPLVLEIDTSLIPIMEVGITGELPYEEMRDIAKSFETKVKEVPGVARCGDAVDLRNLPGLHFSHRAGPTDWDHCR